VGWWNLLQQPWWGGGRNLQVDLFVMGLCPYGLQTEKAFIPVVDLLGDDLVFSVKFCNYTVHGVNESLEQLRQYCIQKHYPGRFMDYLECFVGGGGSVDCLSAAGINEGRVLVCMDELDGRYGILDDVNQRRGLPSFPLFQDDVVEYGVDSSPTLVIDGGVVSYFDRSPAALLELICGYYDVKPSGCYHKLSSQTPRVGFNNQ